MKCNSLYVALFAIICCIIIPSTCALRSHINRKSLSFSKRVNSQRKMIDESINTYLSLIESDEQLLKHQAVKDFLSVCRCKFANDNYNGGKNGDTVSGDPKSHLKTLKTSARTNADSTWGKVHKCPARLDSYINENKHDPYLLFYYDVKVAGKLEFETEIFPKPKIYPALVIAFDVFPYFGMIGEKNALMTAQIREIQYRRYLEWSLVCKKQYPDGKDKNHARNSCEQNCYEKHCGNPMNDKDYLKDAEPTIDSKIIADMATCYSQKAVQCKKECNFGKRVYYRIRSSVSNIKKFFKSIPLHIKTALRGMICLVNKIIMNIIEALEKTWLAIKQGSMKVGQALQGATQASVQALKNGWGKTIAVSKTIGKGAADLTAAILSPLSSPLNFFKKQPKLLEMNEKMFQKHKKLHAYFKKLQEKDGLSYTEIDQHIKDIKQKAATHAHAISFALLDMHAKLHNKQTQNRKFEPKQCFLNGVKTESLQLAMEKFIATLSIELPDPVDVAVDIAAQNYAGAAKKLIPEFAFEIDQLSTKYGCLPKTEPEVCEQVDSEAIAESIAETKANAKSQDEGEQKSVITTSSSSQDISTTNAAQVQKVCLSIEKPTDVKPATDTPPGKGWCGCRYSQEGMSAMFEGLSDKWDNDCQGTTQHTLVETGLLQVWDLFPEPSIIPTSGVNFELADLRSDNNKNKERQVVTSQGSNNKNQNSFLKWFAFEKNGILSVLDNGSKFQSVAAKTIRLGEKVKAKFIKMGQKLFKASEFAAQAFIDVVITLLNGFKCIFLRLAHWIAMQVRAAKEFLKAKAAKVVNGVKAFFKKKKQAFIEIDTSAPKLIQEAAKKGLLNEDFMKHLDNLSNVMESKKQYMYEKRQEEAITALGTKLLEISAQDKRRIDRLGPAIQVQMPNLVSAISSLVIGDYLEAVHSLIPKVLVIVRPIATFTKKLTENQGDVDCQVKCSLDDYNNKKCKDDDLARVALCIDHHHDRMNVAGQKAQLAIENEEKIETQKLTETSKKDPKALEKSEKEQENIINENLDVTKNSKKEDNALLVHQKKK